MAKFADNDMIDASLNFLKTNCDRIFLCSAQPANWTEANATYNLCTFSINSTNYTGPADGDANGRKVTINQVSGVNATANGTANHVILGISGNTTIKYGTTCANQSVTSGNPIQINAWDVEIADPS